MAGTLTKRGEVYTSARSLLRVTPIESQASKSLSKDDIAHYALCSQIPYAFAYI